MKTEKLIKVNLDVFAKTDVGPIRDHNEDNFLVCNLTTGEAKLSPQIRQHSVGSKGSLFIVADGVGGAEAGEVASQIATRKIYDSMSTALSEFGKESSPSSLTIDNWGELLRSAVQDANRAIRASADKGKEGRKEMGSTVTALIVSSKAQAFIAHVGDSRLYCISNGRIKQVTRDHSLVQELVEDNLISQEKAKNHPNKNVITRCLGQADWVQVDLFNQGIEDGDVFVLCSDGVTNGVSDEEICKIIIAEKDCRDACSKIVSRAAELYGKDNATVIVVRVAIQKLQQSNQSKVHPEIDTKYDLGISGQSKQKIIGIDPCPSVQELNPASPPDTCFYRFWYKLIYFLNQTGYIIFLLLFIALLIVLFFLFKSLHGYHIASQGENVGIFHGCKALPFLPFIEISSSTYKKDDIIEEALPLIEKGLVVAKTLDDAENLLKTLVRDPQISDGRKNGQGQLDLSKNQESEDIVKTLVRDPQISDGRKDEPGQLDLSKNQESGDIVKTLVRDPQISDNRKDEPGQLDLSKNQESGDIEIQE